MSPIGERLTSYWSAHGLKPPPSVPKERLREFEGRFGVTLPVDMGSYFLRVDGMGSRDVSDDDWFSFWSLEEIVQASDEYLDQFIEEQSSYFVFADHSICLPAYAIRLTPDGTGPHRVIAIYSDRREYSISVVAHSFSEFAERYLADENSRSDLSAGVSVET